LVITPQTKRRIKNPLNAAAYVQKVKEMLPESDDEHCPQCQGVLRPGRFNWLTCPKCKVTYQRALPNIRPLQLHRWSSESEHNVHIGTASVDVKPLQVDRVKPQSRCEDCPIYHACPYGEKRRVDVRSRL